MPYPSHREALLIYGAPTLALSGCRVCMAATTENLSELEARDEPAWNAPTVTDMFTGEHMDGV